MPGLDSLGLPTLATSRADPIRSRPVTTSPDATTPATSGRPYAVLATVLFLVGIGGFGTASSGDVTMFGLTMQAKYACFIFFVLGGVFAWSALEAKKRGIRVL